jgi:hypothetical protein
MGSPKSTAPSAETIEAKQENKRRAAKPQAEVVLFAIGLPTTTPNITLLNTMTSRDP